MSLHDQYLDAMGIQRWQLKPAFQAESEVIVTEPVAPEAVAAMPEPAPPAALTTEPELSPESLPEPVMDVPPKQAAETITPVTMQHVAGLDWEALQAAVKDCTECPLHQGRTQTVFGVGDNSTKLMIVGEGPGAEEDKQGEPFVGRAGKLLDAMLYAAGFAREDVYIANVVKCRPPNNRNPEPTEMVTCGTYLARQIEIIQPDLLLAVGRIPAQYLLNQDIAIGALRGKKHVYQPTGAPVVVTYHPAYLLRRPEEKYKSWQDLQFVMRLLESM